MCEATKVIPPKSKPSKAKSDDEKNSSQDNEDQTENPASDSPSPPKKTKKGRLAFYKQDNVNNIV